MLTLAAVSGSSAITRLQDAAPAPLVEEMVREARAAWPALDVPDDEFISYVAERLPHGEVLSNLCTRDLYLAQACARGDARAIAAFEHHCVDTIKGALARLSAGDDVLNQVKQRLRCNLLVADGKPAGITSFSGRGNLRAWVRVIATREALAILRPPRQDTPLEDALLEQRVARADDPELSLLKGIYREEFKRAFATALADLGDRERTLLKQQLLDGLSIDDLGALYRVHRATAARWLEQARQHLVGETLAAMQARLAVQPDELASIMRLIRSHLDVSLGGLQRRGRRR
jgi:RNA polymerase sigma-70 factor (ECF subfamily)